MGDKGLTGWALDQALKDSSQPLRDPGYLSARLTAQAKAAYGLYCEYAKGWGESTVSWPCLSERAQKEWAFLCAASNAAASQFDKEHQTCSR